MMVKHGDFLKWDGTHGYRLTHDFFRFPGKFHPPLVEHILRSIKPQAVLDPMAGVGTVAVEAKAAGIPSLSIDIDPLSVFFTKVKTTPISKRTLDSAWGDLSGSLEKFRRSREEIQLRRFQDIRTNAMRTDLNKLKARDLERLTYWFRKYVLVDYARINHFVFNGGLPSRSDAVRRFFSACLLSAVRRISLADPSPVSGLEITKHMKKKISLGYDIDVFKEFERRVELSIARMDEYASYLRDNGTLKTPSFSRLADSADLLDLYQPDGFKADLILFSPPYCNAIEYWRRHRLEYLLGGFLNEIGISQLHRKFIGRTAVGRDNAELQPLGYHLIDNLIEAVEEEGRRKKARVLWHYFDDMKKRLKIFNEYLPNNGYCVIVVGDSHTGERTIPTGRTLTQMGNEIGFEHVSTSRYVIRNRAMQFPLKSNSKIEMESIIVFYKP